MSRINTNVQALTAQRGLAGSQKLLGDTLNRLSTGLRINRGADDPAGLIASEQLRSEITGINQAISNSQRASNVIATSEGALSEVASLLLNIKSLVVESANTGALSPDEINANQLQVESAIESITRISNTTSFAGLKLLDGSLDYVTSGVSASQIADVHVTQANFGTQDDIAIDVNVTASAQQAQLTFTGLALSAPYTLDIAGNEGTDTLSFAASATVSQMATAINTITDSTGVAADVTASGLVFHSVGYGSKSFVSVTAQGGQTLALTDSTGGTRTRTTGVDATATINGTVATTDGLNLKLNTTNLDVELTLDKSFGTGQTNFSITEGGSLFQLGPRVKANEQVNIGIQSVAASKLGSLETGYLTDIVGRGPANLTKEGGPAKASAIIEDAIKQIAVLRGRLGAFEKNTLQTNVNNLSITLENVTASESSIRDADFAKETSALTRARILTQAGTSVLATANSSPQQVLSLLGGR
ncbi:MAG: flagellin [Tepidisphaeraceae bacterium]